MITPEYLSDIMAAVEEKLVDVDNYLIRRIIKRIMDTFESDEFADLLIPSTKSDIRKLLKAGVLYEDVQQAVEKALTDIAGAVREAFYASAVEITRQNIEIAKKIVELEGLSVNVPEYEQAGIPKKASELGMTKYEIRQLEAAYRRTNGEIKNLTRTTASKAQEAYINACDMAYMKVKQGVSVQTAVIEAIKDVADSGTQCVTYGGKKENIEVAVARAVRTGVNQANGNIVLTRCAEMGVQYVKTSWHMGARVTKAGDYTSHDTWQGKVFHINWDTPDMQEFAEAAGVEEPGYEWIEQMRKSMKKDKKIKYDDFIEKTGYGDILGLCGINCRHSFYPFYPGIQLNDDERPDLKENEKRFRLDQKQRAMERNMRKTRRELAGLEAAKKDTEEFRAEKREVREKLKKQSDKYFDFCNDNGLKPRNMAFKIGGNIPNKKIVRSVSVDDLKEANVKAGSEIGDDVIQEISRVLDKYNGFKEFDKIEIGKASEGAAFDTVTTDVGTWCSNKLVISKNMFADKTVNQVNELFKSSKKTVCNSLEDGIVHELCHAKLSNSMKYSQYKNICESDAIDNISSVADQDLSESLAEMSVLINRGEADTISKTNMDIYRRYIKW